VHEEQKNGHDDPPQKARWTSRNGHYLSRDDCRPRRVREHEQNWTTLHAKEVNGRLDSKVAMDWVMAYDAGRQRLDRIQRAD